MDTDVLSLLIYFIISMIFLIFFQPEKLKIVVYDFTNIYFLIMFLSMLTFSIYILFKDDINYKKRNAVRAGLSAFVIAYLAKLNYVFSAFSFVYIIHSFNEN